MERSGRGSELDQEQPGQRSLRQVQLQSYQWALKQKLGEGLGRREVGTGSAKQSEPKEECTNFHVARGGGKEGKAHG